MRTLKNALLGTAICLLNIVAVHAQDGNGWSVGGPKNIAGRILAIHVDVNNSQRLYAGAAGGGLWISTNQGLSWSRSEFTGSAAVSAIVQSSDGTLYIGTGEGLNTGYVDPGVRTNIAPFGIKGDGVYKSTDGGVSFTHLSGTEHWIEVNSMAYDNANNKLYVATNEGLKISSDAGDNFVDADIPQSKGINVSVSNNGTVIYSNYSGGGDVHISKDAGTTFTSVCGNAPKLPHASGYITVDIVSSNDSIIYAMLSEQGAFGGVYVSRDKGNTWSVIFPKTSLDDPLNGWGTFCNVLKTPPTAPSWVFAGGLYLYLGKEWDKNRLFSWIDYVSYGASTFPPTPRPLFVHCMAFDGNIAYVGTNAGINIIQNIGDDVNVIGERNNNLGTMQSYTLGVANDGRMMIGARDNGTMFIERPGDAARAGERIMSDYQDGGDCVFSFIKPEALFYTGNYGSCYRQASAYSDPQVPSAWYGASNKNTIIMAQNAQETRWHGGSSNPRVTPLLMWESVNDINSIDSVMFVVDKTYAPGDTICVKSKQNNYPIWMEYTGMDTLKRNQDTLYVQDIVTSRLFMGGAGYKFQPTATSGMGAPVFMTTSALDFINENEWICVFRTLDTADQVMDLAVSKDGDHLFVLVKHAISSSPDYSIYRVSGFDTYRAPIEIDVAGANYGEGGFLTPNSNRKLQDDLILKYDVDDVLGISLDPENNNTLIFVTNGAGWGNRSRIYTITDALTATDGDAIYESKEGTGIPEDIAAYSAIVEMSHSNIAYIGTEEGVYKTTNFTSSTPEWSPYNDGIFVKTPVFRLFQQTNLFPHSSSVTYDAQGEATYLDFPGTRNYGAIYAATHGLGVFVDSTYWEDTPPPAFIWNLSMKPNNIEVRVFPNPATTSVTIDFMLANSGSVNIELTDLMGRIIMTKQLGDRMIGSHQEILDCSNLLSGLYFITIKSDNKMRTAKIVIQR